MKVFCVALFFIHIVISKEVQYRTTGIDLVLERLEENEWSIEERPCIDQTVLILENAKNYTVWAMWIWNSMQYPVGTFYGSFHNLGHYDQCLQAPAKTIDVNTQYCLADVKLTRQKHRWEDRNVMGDTASYVGTITNMKRDISRITWGICLPAACMPGSAAKVLKAIYMANPVTAAEPSIEIDHCQVSGVKKEYDTAYYAFFSLILTIISLAVFSTFYVSYAKPDATSTQLARSFCMKRNWLSLTREAPADDISILNAVKTVHACAAVVIHGVYFAMNGPIGNVLDFDSAMSSTETDNTFKKVTKNISMPINTFFVISGLLTMKGLIENNRSPLVSIVNRYFRLIGTFTIVIFYVAAVSMYTGDGPLWEKLAGREQKAASNNWLWNFLLLNNHVNNENISQIVAWHVPCDFQLSIMATILVMLWQKDWRLGRKVTIIVCILAFIAPVAATYWMNLSGLVVSDDVNQLLDARISDVYLETHIKSYHNALPYLLGMAMGYIMTVYKPEKYRQSIPLEQSLLILVVTTMIMFKVHIAGASWCTADRLSLLTYVAFGKLIFCIGICVSIGLVEYGSWTILRRVSQFHGFTVLNRLIYGMYMSHSIFYQHHAYSQRYTQQYDLFSWCTYGIGVLCLSIMVAVPLWLFVEAPLSNLVGNLLIKSGRSNFKELDVKDQATKKIEECPDFNKLKAL